MFTPSGLVIGFSMTPPILDSSKDDLVIPVHETITITCRYVGVQLWGGSVYMQQCIAVRYFINKRNSILVEHKNKTRAI